MNTALVDRLPSDRTLGYLAAGLAYLVAALHLFHPSLGGPRLAQVLLVDPGLLVTDPRPLAFVLSGFAIIVGVSAVFVGVPRRAVYAAGLALMATYVVGYFAWHLSGHGGFLPGREPLYHGLAPHVALVSHLRTDPWARVAVAAELVLAATLAVLLVRES